MSWRPHHTLWAVLGLGVVANNALSQTGSLAAPVVGGWLRDATASFAGGAYASAAVLWLAAAGVLVVYRRSTHDR